MRIEEIVLNAKRNVKMTALLQEVGGEFPGFDKRPAMMVLPGGGYSMCSDREADPVALAYAKAGYQVFILRYSVNEHKEWPNPLNDYDQAVDLIKEKSEEWHVAVDKFAVVGFSAGGHLAACAATIARNRPAAVVLGYPAILKEMCDACAPNLPQPNEKVDRMTPPCFLFAARDDNVVPVQNLIAFEEALLKAGINFESHIYSYGMHGFTTAEEYLNNASVSRRVKNWVEDSIGWLEEVLGHFTYNGFSKPEIGRAINGNFEPMLSVYCTVAHLEKQGESVAALLKDIFAGINATLASKGFSPEVAGYLKNMFTLKGLLETINQPKEVIDKLDNELRQIPNRE